MPPPPPSPKLGQLPSGWEQRTDPSSGRPFYYDRSTGKTQWELPVPDEQRVVLPQGWDQRIDPQSGRMFFVHLSTQRTSWNPPSNTTNEPLPPNWEERADENGTPYYLNTLSLETQYERPTNVLGLVLPSVGKEKNETSPYLVGQNNTQEINQISSLSTKQNAMNSDSNSTQNPNATAIAKPLKFVTVGDGAVGKTCLLIHYTRNLFLTDYIPTVFDNKSYVVQFEGKEYNLGLWDTAGQEEYDRLRPLSYPSTDCFLICFSIASPPSMENCRLKWKSELSHYCPYAKTMLVGTQKDLRDDPAVIKRLDEDLHRKPVSTAEGEKLMKDIDCTLYLECSAKTGEGVHKVFEEAIRICSSTVPTKKRSRKCTVL